MTQLFILIFVAIALFVFYKKLAKHESDKRKFAEAANQYQYMQFFRGTGIAVDPKMEKILLRANGTQKEYAFSAVRGWSSNISTGGHIVSANPLMTLAMTGANVQRDKQNKANTGLFIEVKDIEYPIWQICFPPSSMSSDMARWMEVLRQSINKDS